MLKKDKKQHIVKSNLEFQKIISHKKQVVSRFAIVYYKKSPCFQYGISIPKKFAIAAKRNFLKRQIREIIRNNIKEINIKLNQIVIIVRKEFINLDFHKKQEELLKLLRKIRINEEQSS